MSDNYLKGEGHENFFLSMDSLSDAINENTI